MEAGPSGRSPTTIRRRRRAFGGGTTTRPSEASSSISTASTALTTLLHRDVTGEGQHVDVSASAAGNVTTESGTFFWLVARQTVQRQTGRHAAPVTTMQVQVEAGDGRHVTTGFLPQSAEDFQAILEWLDELGLRETAPEVFFLDMGVARGGINFARDRDDPEAMSILGAAREALVHIARSEEHTSELQSRQYLVCRLLLEKKR